MLCHEIVLCKEGDKMKIQFKEAGENEKEAIRSLLTNAKLHTETVDGNVTKFWTAIDDGRIVGVAGLEFYEGDALLRSVAVVPEIQHQGLGSQMVDFVLGAAREKNVRNVILLTETARDFFLKKGFHVVERSSIENEAVKRSSEFVFVCPRSAVCMMLGLK